MMKKHHILWLGLTALLLGATGCPVDVNEGMGGDDDDGPAAECQKTELATVRIVHAAGGTPVTRPQFGPSTTRNLNVVRSDGMGGTLTVASLAAGRATLVQLCGNRPLTLGARLAGASANRATVDITLTPDTDSSLLDAGVTLVLAGISDALKADGTPENPRSAADPLQFIVVPDTFSAGATTEIQVVHASRKTPALVDVEVNPDASGVDLTALARYTASAVTVTKGTTEVAPSSVPVAFSEAGSTKASFTISPRIPAGAKALAIHLDTEVFDPDNPDPAARNPAPTARLFLTGDDPLLGKVAGGGLTF